MPTLSRRACRGLRCPQLVQSADGYCDGCRAQRQPATDQRRGSARQRGYTRDWEKARAVFLASNPVCLECLKQGKAVVATDVDHITPHRGDQTLFWDQSNWQPLCGTCHKRKTGRGQ